MPYEAVSLASLLAKSIRWADSIETLEVPASCSGGFEAARKAMGSDEGV